MSEIFQEIFSDEQIQSASDKMGASKPLRDFLNLTCDSFAEQERPSKFERDSVAQHLYILSNEDKNPPTLRLSEANDR